MQHHLSHGMELRQDPRIRGRAPCRASSRAATSQDLDGTAQPPCPIRSARAWPAEPTAASGLLPLGPAHDGGIAAARGLISAWPPPPAGSRVKGWGPKSSPMQAKFEIGVRALVGPLRTRESTALRLVSAHPSPQHLLLNSPHAVSPRGIEPGVGLERPPHTNYK